MLKTGKLRISAVRNKAFEDPKYAIANVGESIQSVAMQFIYDQCGIKKQNVIKINQCDVKQYKGGETILPLRLPLSKESVDDYLPLDPCVHPFFISLHLHDDIFDGRDDLVEYFKKFEPIGCRDEISCNFFRKRGIKSYIMGCYTLMFLPRKESVKTKHDKVFLVDVSEDLMSQIPSSLKEGAIIKTHATPYQKYPVTPDEDDRLERLAKGYLDEYKEARLVITSRLHAAAPCVAMGIPVILASDNADFRYAWIDAFLPLYQEPDYDSIDWDPNPPDISFVRNNLMKVFNGILNHQRMDIRSMEKLDKFYRNRNSATYYKLFRKRLERIGEMYSEKPFTYAIWGAGNHALFAFDLMKEMYPNGTIVAVVDRFKRGMKFGVPVIPPDSIKEYRPDHICISTRPGMEDAIRGCKELYGEEYEAHYSLVASQQKS